MSEIINTPPTQADRITEEERLLLELRSHASSFFREMSYYKCAMLEVETKFRVLSEDFSYRHDRNPIESVRSRLKSPESIIEKIKRRGLPLSLQSVEENLFDVAGVRVICGFVDDVYALADSFLGQDDVRLVVKKDYIKKPKENGYRSLHLVVEIPIFLFEEKKYMKVEIQMRTIAMDFWASLEHQMRYKKDDSRITEGIRAELYECAAMSAELDGRMNDLRIKILGD